MTVVQVDDLMLTDESGFACSKTKLVDVGLPHLRPFNISDDGSLYLGDIYQVPIEDAPDSKRELLPGDVLFNNTNSVELVGKSTIVRERMVAGYSNHITRIRVNAERIEPEYFALWLRQLRSTGFFSSQATQWVSQAAFRASELRKLALVLPELSEQRRIVDLLARAEGIARLRREAQQKAAELIPAIFIDMFGDPATNPKGWQMSAIEELCPVQTGATPRKEVRLYYEGGTVPWIRTGEVRGLHIRDAAERITELAVRDTNCKVFPVNTVLVAMYGQGQTRGRTGMLMTPAATNQACAAILPSDKINAMFLFEVVKLQYERLRAMGRGGNQANLNLGMIKAFQVPRPPMEAQLRFVERVTALESIQRQQAAAARMSLATFDALLARAFA